MSLYEIITVITIAVLSVALICFASVRLFRLVKQYSAGDDYDSFDDSFMWDDGGLFNRGTHPAGILLDTMLYTIVILLASVVWPATFIVIPAWAVAYCIRRKNLRVKKVMSTLRGEEDDTWLTEYEDDWQDIKAQSNLRKMPIIRQRKLVGYK